MCCLQSLLTSLSAIVVEKVPVVRKIIYAVGTLPYALTLNIIGFYFNVFLLDVALVRLRDLLMMYIFQYDKAALI